MEKVARRKTSELCQHSQGGSDSFIEVVCAREVMVVKCMAKAAFAVSTVAAENGCSSDDTFVADLEKTFDCKPGAKATMSGGFARTEDENDFQKSVALYVLIEWNVSK